METENKEDIKPTELASDSEIQPEETPADQDPLKPELERVKRKRTPEEKLLYKKRLIDQQVKELGLEEEDDIIEDDDDKPLTRGDFKKMQAEVAQKTALQLAQEIEAETERELVVYHLENTIRSTGNPQEDLKLAKSLVDSVKNRQTIEEIARKPVVKNHSSGSGAPARIPKPEEDLTQEEKLYLSPPWNMKKEDILKIREGKIAPKFDSKKV